MLRRRRRIVITTTVAVAVITGLQSVHQRLFHARYVGGFQLLISNPLGDQAPGGGGAAAGTAAPVALNTTTRIDMPTLVGVLQSPLLIDEIVRRYGRAPSGLSVTPIDGGGPGRFPSGILQVSITGTDPVSDGELLKGVAQVYLDYALKERQEKLTSGLRFLDQQVPALEARLGGIQAEMAAFRRRNDLIDPVDDATAWNRQLKGVEEQLIDLSVERQRLEQARRAIQSGRLTASGFREAIGGAGGSGGAGGGAAGGAASGGGSLTLTANGLNLLKQLDGADQQLAEARSRFAESSPTVRALQARRAQLLPLLRTAQLEALDAAVASNTNRTSVAERQKQRLQVVFSRQPGLIKVYENLQERLAIARTNLSGLLQTRENFQLEIAQRTMPWRLIAPPGMNPVPVSPSIPNDLTRGLILGLVAGGGLALLRDRLDHVFHAPREVGEELQLPMLAHVPHFAFFQGVREDRRFLLEDLDRSIGDHSVSEQPADDAGPSPTLSGYQRFSYQEAFRNLFTSLRFLKSDQPLRSVALTSSIPAEGKSLVNVLLAKTIAEMGQRVLLVDADLRRPQLHHRLGLNNITGLSNLLTEEGVHWRQVIQPMASIEGWSVITAGRRPPDPTRLLSSARMHQLVADLASSGDFDLVLYDTPPMLGLADAALVAQHLDGLILLVSLGYVDRAMPANAASRIRSSGAALLGVVTNAVKTEAPGSSGLDGYGSGRYGYGGYYGYGAAYDPRSTYAYYGPADTSAGAGGAPDPQRLTRVQRVVKRLNRARGQLMRWLDA